MAEAVIMFAVQRLADLLISEAKFLHGQSHQIDEIQRELKRMQCFLKEADKKQIQDDRVRNWVAEVRYLAFKTEDIIETRALEVASKKQTSGLRKMLRRIACTVSEGASLHKFGVQINTVKSELTSLTASLQTFGITKGLEEGQTSNSANLKNRRIFYPNDIQKDFVGMEKEMHQLISHLMAEGRGCEVVSICGMGGQGKTTVATKLYNNSQLQVHFQAFAWISVTQQFGKENILKSILKQLLPAQRKEEISKMENNEFVRELWNILQEKNCLVVMDDIWTSDAWANLCSAFPIGMTNSGSKLLLTTRNETVAKVGSMYKLPGLTEEQGWQLLSRKAFPVKADSPEIRVAAELESIGKKMVKRCKGLPLAISTLGGILRGKMLREWEMINKDISFYLARGGGVVDNDEYYTVMQVLGLSYDNLPPHLRHCFLCLANFREDEKIKAEELYLFWIAEGLVSLKDRAEGEMMMDVAERYLDELANRSLVQVEQWMDEGESWSKFQVCSVHDLIRDLCSSKVKEEKVISVIDLQSKPDEEIDNRVRKLCIRSYDHKYESTFNEQVNPQIRSLLLFSDNDQINNLEEKILSVDRFKLLRVLMIRGFKVSDGNLRSIANLMYLKYLSYYGSKVDALPSSIGNLRNLETLDLRVRSNVKIPNVLWKLKQLKRLYLPKHLHLPAPLIGDYIKDNERLRFDGLNELEILENFDSDYCETRDLVGLRKIKVFSGEIIVDQEKLIENTIELIKSNELRNSRLVIKGGGVLTCFVILLECSFIDRLHISTSICALPKEYDHNRLSRRLTSLVLLNCKLEEDPMKLLEKLPNLRSLCLNVNSYTGTKMICSAMGFHQLQTLFLFSLPNLTNWMVAEGAMPNLSRLHIHSCNKLEMLPDKLRFPALKHLDIKSMPLEFRERFRVTVWNSEIPTKCVTFLL